MLVLLKSDYLLIVIVLLREIASISGFKHYPLSQFGKWAPTITQDFDLEKETFFLVRC